MKFPSVKYILFVLVAAFTYSCIDETESVTLSSDASFVSLKLNEDDSIPGLEDAVFTLQDDGETVTNVDSLPYNTDVDSVMITLSFTSSSSVKIGGEPMTGKDTLNFTEPVTIVNYAADGIVWKKYTIKVNVHKVKPEDYNWSFLRKNIYGGAVYSQKALVLNEMLLYFINDGAKTFYYDLGNGTALSGANDVSGLPAVSTLDQMVEFKNKLYLAPDSNALYTSATGSSWTSSTWAGYKFKAILYTLHDKLWAIAKSDADGKYYFASSADGASWSVSTEVPALFPLKDFSAVSFMSRIGLPKAFVVGGKDLNGKVTSWSTENGSYWVNYSKSNRSLDSLVNVASVIAYDNKLLLMGEGINKKTKIHYRVSTDEGFSWSQPDTLLNRLPVYKKLDNDSNFVARSKVSFVVYKPLATKGTYTDNKSLVESNFLYIIGGKNDTKTYTDVWKGKLNRLSFLRQ